MQLKGRLNDVRRQMDSLESKMKASKKSTKYDENKTYFRQQVYFDNNSETLQAEYLRYVQDLTQILIKYPEAKILLEGWASPLGSVNYNKQLSMRRAESVEKAFVNNNIQASRIITSFKGEDKKSSAAHARRVEMSIIVRQSREFKISFYLKLLNNRIQDEYLTFSVDLSLYLNKEIKTPDIR